MSFRFILFFFLGCSFFLMSCNNEPKAETKQVQVNAFSNFYVRYLQDDQTLKSEAIFKIGDSIHTAQTQTVHSVSFEETPMEMKDLGKNGIRYRSSKAKQVFKNDYTFNVSVTEQQQFSYPLSIHPIEKFALKENILSRSKGTTISWEGTALAKGELLVAFFINPDKKPVSLTINGPTNGSEVFLEAKNLARLQVGKGQLRLIRKSLKKREDAPKNIESVIEYYTKPIDIDIAD